MDYNSLLKSYIDLLLTQKGSDLHLIEGYNPIIRVNKNLERLRNYEKLKREDIEAFIELISSTNKNDLPKILKENKQVLFSFKTTSSSEEINFRGNIYYTKGGLAVALRLVPLQIKTIKELGLPLILEEIAKEKQGLFLFVGPTGNGKSTSMSAVINHINYISNQHILTIEEPIEFIYKEVNSIISQREIPSDANNFESALENALRADCDTIVIGETREKETMKAIITAAEVGHLVFSTLHSNSASQTINRIIDSFPPEQQGQIRVQLSHSLLGVCSIRLVPKKDGELIPAYEILLNNKAIGNLIREGKIGSIDSVIQTSSNQGMIGLEQSLANLVKNDVIDRDVAFEFALDQKILEGLI